MGLSLIGHSVCCSGLRVHCLAGVLGKLNACCGQV